MILKEQGLIASTIILTLTSFFTRTLNMISIIFLSHLLGTEGMGLYHLIISVYMIAIVFASAGLSSSVSKLVAEELGQKHLRNASRVMKIALTFSAFLSLLVGVSFFFLAPFIAKHFVQDTRAILSLRILSISIPFIACSSCFKGYFYATKKASLPASSEMLEQIVKVGLTLLILSLKNTSNQTYTYGLIGLCLTIGEIVSWSYLLSLYILSRKHTPYTTEQFSSSKSLFLNLIKIALPIAAISYVSCIFVSTENILIPAGLKKYGASAATSLSLYGMLKGMVIPILFFPSAFLTAFCTTLIPEIARANILKQKTHVHSIINTVLQFTLMLSIFATSLFINYADEIGIVLYHNDQIGSMLRCLAIIVPFMYVEVVADAILKGLGKQVSCLKYSIFDTLFRITTIYFFLPIKGISAFIGIMIISNITTSCLNFNKLRDTTKLKIQFTNWILNPLIASFAGTTFSKLILNVLFHYNIATTFRLILGIGLSILICLFVLITLMEYKFHHLVTWSKAN